MTFLESIPLWAFIWAGSILLVGLAMFVFLVVRARRKHRAIKHYEEMRDKLTLREPEPEPEPEVVEEEGPSGDIIAPLISAGIMIFIAFTMLPLIMEETESAQASNVTSAMSSALGSILLDIIPAMFCLSIVFVAISVVWRSLTAVGVV